MKKAVNLKISTFAFLLVVTALLVFFNNLGYLAPVNNFLFYVSMPLQNVFQTSSNELNNFAYVLKDIDKFKTENIELKKENLRLTYEVSNLKEIRKENDILRRQLGFSGEACTGNPCFKMSLATVIGRSSDNHGGYIMVNVGKKKNVQEGQAAIVAPGVLVGKVTEVYDSYSKIMLLTSPESSINSITQETRANGVSKGKYGTGVKLEMINQNEQLKDGDIVITSGLEDKTPKGLLVGKISNIQESANKVFKQADVNLYADFSRIEEVFIIDQNG